MVPNENKKLTPLMHQTLKKFACYLHAYTFFREKDKHWYSNNKSPPMQIKNRNNEYSNAGNPNQDSNQSR